jgi:prolyl-tRNA synthetase
MVHGDDKGLVIPPRLARHQVVIVPIVFEENKAQLLAKAASLRSALAPLSILIDDRDGYSPGWKFNEWELKGVPVRIELGPKDLAKKQVIVVRRDTGVKEAVPEEQLPTYLPALLERIHQDMFAKAKRFVDGQVMTASSLKELQKGIKERKLVKVYMVDDPKVEQKVKDATDGATSRFVEEVAKEGTCIQTGEKTYTVAYFAKSY